MTASELVENAEVPDHFRQVVVLYLETYEVRVGDVYRMLRHKVIALAHFWWFVRDKHLNVKRCSEIPPGPRPRLCPRRDHTRSRRSARPRSR